ncbi:MFS transporter [Yinghuangia soli]|uniref:MFS transporter n=1 Tax=Yinghuangia soli TaxID=2908204 RepID=A0AA41PXV1_9ACTN|nr:MFS transporter [Yinghuangia soli]MCF2527748.1 MFS transporter [Yinghuangia soli]
MTPRQRLILVILLGSQFMLAVDFSILNVALPKLGDGLGFRLADLQWVATSFALAAAGFTLVFGRVADLVGRRRMFMIGMALLIAGSLVGGLAATPGWLLVGRVLQGLATAMATPAALALLTTSFPEGPLRARALGLNGALLASGFTAGAVFGGVLTDALSWRWAFLINVPIGLVVLLATPSVITESRAAERTGLDIPGTLTAAGGLLALVFGITRAGEHGWGDTWALAALAAGVVLLVAFWFVELHAEAPLASVRMLKRRSISWGNLAGFVTFTMESALVYLMTLYLQQVLGYSAMQTGLAFGVIGIACFIGGVVAPRVIARIGAPGALVLGLLVQGVTTAAVFNVGDDRGQLPLILAALSLGGVGHLFAIVGYMVTATSGVPDDEQGLATGIASMTQQVGLALGIPVISSIATARMDSLSDSHSATDALLEGIGTAVLVNAAVVLAGAVLVGFALLRRNRADA